MKKQVIIALSLFLGSTLGYAQDEQAGQVANIVNEAYWAPHLRFLSSDEMGGRNTGSVELNIAARYLAEQFKAYGLQPPEGSDNYFQPVPLTKSAPPEEAVLEMGNDQFSHGKQMLVTGGGSNRLVDLEAEIIFAGYATEADLANLDVEGKIVVANAGEKGNPNARQYLRLSRQKAGLVEEMGGLALVELYKSPLVPWKLLVKYLNTEQIRLAAEDASNDSDLPRTWIDDAKGKYAEAIGEGKYQRASLRITGAEEKQLNSKNVIAVIEGTDPELKNEYLALGAHYDHVGSDMSKAKNGDGIFNGTRDNAVGTVGLLSAARYFSEHPPKRSVVFIAFTAEEKGLLGSQYYASNPLVPLEQTIYNFNIDNAGYNDVSRVSIFGFGRTSIDPILEASCEAFGLEAKGDPAPEQNLFDRSDNVNFARAGVPAITFSLGFTAFDKEILKYYHQVTDEYESLDKDYINKYYRSYVMAAIGVANMEQTPFWNSGDKYEEAGKDLYGLE